MIISEIEYFGFLGGIWYMRLTKRRQQFLDTIVRLFEERGEPIHYEDIAIAIGVSKWTAYDAVRALEKQGLVNIEYMVNQNVPQVGRSRIGVIPKDVVPRAAVVQGDSDKEDFHSLIEKAMHDVRNLTMKELIRRVKSSKSNSLVCVYVACLLLHLLKERLGVRAFSLVGVLGHAADADNGLVIAVGIVIGIILGCGVDKEYSHQLKDWVKQFQERVVRISDDERAHIQKFWNETIAGLDV